MANVTSFLALDEKKRDAAAAAGLEKKVERVIRRKTDELEEAVESAEENLSKVSTITTLKGFNASDWVNARNNALTNLANAKADLAEFVENFSDTTEA